ncbi:MAG: hypothetical protein RI575_08630 [Balneolaceae bacterium]|nr:hypothetical protein [Balneolaceae bacterium]MDR9407605.1 hypothetical protein [Balneolaceae bacterium]
MKRENSRNYSWKMLSVRHDGFSNSDWTSYDCRVVQTLSGTPFKNESKLLNLK